MTKELHVWLEERWKLDNHNKYQHYFGEWVDNITDTQIQGFSKMEKRRNVYEPVKPVSFYGERTLGSCERPDDSSYGDVNEY